MSKIGYARVSTKDQNLDRQIEALSKWGVERIFEDKASGKNIDRKAYKEMRAYLREGDTLVVSSLDRLGRNARDLHNEVTELSEEKIRVVFIKEGLDLSTSTGKLVFGILASVAEMERENISERQAQGIKSAKEKGKHLGRPKLDKPENWEKVSSDWKDKKITATQATKDLNISRSSFYRLLKQ